MGDLIAAALPGGNKIVPCWRGGDELRLISFFDRLHSDPGSLFPECQMLTLEHPEEQPQGREEERHPVGECPQEEAQGDFHLRACRQ